MEGGPAVGNIKRKTYLGIVKIDTKYCRKQEGRY